ncbi:MAG: hypothetical protein IK057_03315 [Clostridia bacterium]|nr:hypothetical protein [Clostridia bacterium]
MKKTIFCTLTVILTALMIFSPESSIFYSKQALDICYEIIIPSLFPFFICSGILVYSGFAESMAKFFRPVMKPLFNVNENGASAFVLGILSGYPLGAVTACQLYENAYLSKSEAERLLAFCNNSGPLFILGAVGTAIYQNARVGIVLYISHIISAIMTGVLFRFYKRSSFSAPKSRLNTADGSISEIFARVLANSINSILTVCGAIVFFFTMSNVLTNILPVNTFSDAIISALLEFTGGIKKISGLSAPLPFRLAMSSFAVGFAGLCVHLQVMSVTAKYGLSLKPYILGKVLHGFLSAIFTLLILGIFPQTVAVFNSTKAQLSCGFCLSSVYMISVNLLIFLISVFMLFSKNIFSQNKRDA